MAVSVSKPGLLLRVEGATVLIGAVALYFQQGGGWLLFVVLLLAPDLSALGYLAGPGVGSVCYNLVHTYAGPAAVIAAGLLAGAALPVWIGLIWTAHIGMDRMLGFGLKYPTVFQDTHLNRV